VLLSVEKPIWLQAKAAGTRLQPEPCVFGWKASIEYSYELRKPSGTKAGSRHCKLLFISAEGIAIADFQAEIAFICRKQGIAVFPVFKIAEMQSGPELHPLRMSQYELCCLSALSR